MKNIIFSICFLLVIAFVTSCHKTNVQTNLLIGKWSIVNDSISLTDIPNGSDRGSNFIGTPTDYYDFFPNGNLYIKEGNSFDSAAYSMVGDSAVRITVFNYQGISFRPNGGILGTFSITNLTRNMATLTSSGWTPGGYELLMVNLKK